MSLLLFVALGCATADNAGPIHLEPEPIGLAECAVCGMVVGEQPSPRGQLVYRDGSHAHVCSIEETRALISERGPRGAPVGLWVEDLPPEFDWAAMDTGPSDWIAAKEAYFVFGADRPLVMGVPVLTFGDRDEADRVADSLGTRAVSWSEVLRTPTLEIPIETHKEKP